MFILGVVLAIPFSPLCRWFGFTRLPAVYYGYILIIIIAYLAAAELTKYWFYRKLLKLKTQ